MLKNGFHFQEDENYQFSREKEAWPATEAEVRELWRKRVKSDWLRLKLAGKDDKSKAMVADLATRAKTLLETTLKDQMHLTAQVSQTPQPPSPDQDLALMMPLLGLGALQPWPLAWLTDHVLGGN